MPESSRPRSAMTLSGYPEMIYISLNNSLDNRLRRYIQ